MDKTNEKIKYSGKLPDLYDNVGWMSLLPPETETDQDFLRSKENRPRNFLKQPVTVDEIVADAYRPGGVEISVESDLKSAGEEKLVGRSEANSNTDKVTSASGDDFKVTNEDATPSRTIGRPRRRHQRTEKRIRFRDGPPVKMESEKAETRNRVSIVDNTSRSRSSELRTSTVPDRSGQSLPITVNNWLQLYMCAANREPFNDDRQLMANLRAKLNNLNLIDVSDERKLTFSENIAAADGSGARTVRGKVLPNGRSRIPVLTKKVPHNPQNADLNSDRPSYPAAKAMRHRPTPGIAAGGRIKAASESCSDSSFPPKKPSIRTTKTVELRNKYIKNKLRKS